MSLKTSTASKDTEIGALLRVSRRARGVSQMKLAKELGISFQQVQKYEKGSNRIALSTFLKACDVLSVSPVELVEALSVNDATSTALLLSKAEECKALTAQLDQIRDIVTRRHNA